MCNIGQYPLFCGHWARQLALKYINCGQSSLYKNHLTEKVEHYIGTGWCWSDKLWRVWHRVTPGDRTQAQTFTKISLRLCGVWCVALWCWWWWSLLVKCDNNVVDLSTSDIADTLLLPFLYTRWSPLQSNLEIQMLQAGSLVSPTHCWYPVPSLYCMTGGWLKSIFYCFPVITRKLMFTTGCALTSHWSNYKEASPCLTRYYITEQLTTRHNYH